MGDVLPENIQDADAATVDFSLAEQSIGEDAASPLSIVVRLNTKD